jgi:cell wall-associated NlpC family hydrolase
MRSIDRGLGLFAAASLRSIVTIGIFCPVSVAASCPAGTYQIGEDEKHIYCKREGAGVDEDMATRAGILKFAMSKLGYPYHEIEGRCLDGDVSMCPTGDHTGGCYDCSALVYDVLRSIGQRVQPSSGNQYVYFEQLPGGLKTSDPIYGDVVFFHKPDGSCCHVGIFVGSRNQRVYYLHSPSTGRTVTVSSTSRTPMAYGNVSILRVSKPLN